MKTTSAKPKRKTKITTSAMRFSGVIAGPVRIVHPAIQRLRIPWQYDHQRHAYLVPIQHLADVEALLASDGYEVSTKGVELA